MATLQAVTLGLSPYAYYRMNETSGTTLVDSSGNGLNGTYTGVTLNQSPLTTNDTGSPTFAGTSASYATTGVLAANANTHGANFSASAWVKIPTVASGSFYNVMSNGNPGSATYKGFGIQLKGGASGTGHADFTVMNTAGTAVAIDPAGAIASATLYHLVAVVDSANNRNVLYVNNVGTNGTYTALSAGADPIVIGQYPEVSANYFSGTISEVAFFASALTAANVAALYTAGTTIAVARRRVSSMFILAP